MIVNLNINTLIGGAVETSVLLGIVLLLRKPVARWFGSSAAYTLWLLPLAGLLLPRVNINKGAMYLPTEIITSYTSAADQMLVNPIAIHTFNVSQFGGLELLFLWMVIGLAWLGFQLLNYRHHYKKNLLLSSECPSPVREIGKSAAREIGLKRMPKIRVCTNGGTPSVMGLFKPMVILPQNFVDEYSPAEQKLVLAHELMHIKRRDLWAGFAALLFRAFNWPNPLVHIAAHYFRTDQEASCDSSVLNVMSGEQVRAQYMSAVVKTAKPCTGV